MKMILVPLLFGLSVPAFAKTHSYIYPMPCAKLWPEVKDTLRNSGKYGIIGIDSTEMTASYNIGGALTGKRINSVVLNTKESGCELQVQTAYSGLVNNDVADLKKRVDDSIVKLQGPAPANSPTAPAATPTGAPPAENTPIPLPGNLATHRPQPALHYCNSFSSMHLFA